MAEVFFMFILFLFSYFLIAVLLEPVSTAYRLNGLIFRLNQSVCISLSLIYNADGLGFRIVEYEEIMS